MVVRSKAVVLLLLIHRLIFLPLFVGVPCVWSLICYALFSEALGSRHTCCMHQDDMYLGWDKYKAIVHK